MSNHKVLLINPPRINGISWTREGRCQEKEGILGTVKPPFSLILIASLLQENKVAFRLIDATALNLNNEEICNHLIESEFHPNIIVYCTTTATILADTKSLSTVKSRFNAKLIAFGAHISGIPKETLEKLPIIDVGIIGEPEYVILDILKPENSLNLNNVKSIVWRKGGNIYLTNKREVIGDLDRLPKPVWELLPLEKYVLPFINEKYLMVETSRGCPFGCEFCVTPLNHGLKFREKQPPTVVNEIAELKERFKVKYFNLFGDTVTFNKKFVAKFCDELIKRNLKIRWFANTRADTLYDIDLVKKMKDSGCWMLSIGIESFNKETRRNMQKKLETDKIKRAVGLLKEVGILSFGFFIYGYPGETERDLYETTKFAISLPLDYANFYPAVPYPGTDFYYKSMENGYLYQNLWNKMEYSSYVLKTKDLDEDIVKKAISHAYLRFYFRPRFIYRHLRNIGLFNFIVGSAKYGLRFLDSKYFCRKQKKHEKCYRN